MVPLKDKNWEQEKTTTEEASQAEREKLYKLHFPESDTTCKIHRQGCVLCSHSRQYMRHFYFCQMAEHVAAI